MKLKQLLLSVAVLLTSALFTQLNAQDEDLLALVQDSTMPDINKSPVYATFKTTKIINTQTIETVKKKTMDFRITHRFSNIGAGSDGGYHTLWGFDDSRDIRFSFDFGITNKLQIGFGRSKIKELLDASVKWRFLEQTKDNKIPVSLCLYGNVGVSPQEEALIYQGHYIFPDRGNFLHRVNYFSQLIIARKFNDFISFQLSPSYHHRNLIVEDVNLANDSAKETNGLFVLGVGGRIKITKRIAIIGDFYYIFSKFRQNNDAFENPLALGVEIETGGHVFHLTFTNASGILENNLIPDTRDKWLKGGFKFGFNISRVFNL